MSVAGGRLSMAQIAARIVAKAADPAIHVGTIFDQDYSEKFGKVWPAIWVGAIKTTPRDSGQGLTEIMRQNTNVQVALRLLIQRNPPASVTTVDLETRVNALYNVVIQAMFGWTPTGARCPFAIASSVDGPASEPSCSVDVIVATQSAYSGSSP